MIAPRLLFVVAGLGTAALCAGAVTSASAAPLPQPGGARTAHHAAATATVHNPLLKQTLADEDDDDGDDAPNLAAQCAKYAGKPNPYPATGSNVDMIVGDNLQSTGTSSGCSTPQNETTIATNPANPANIVAGANDYRVFNSRTGRNDSSGYAYTSFDGGKSWTDSQLPGLTYQTGAVGPLRAMDGAGDPIVAFGPNNIVYYGNITYSRGTPATGGTEAPSAITVNVSRNGGRTFGKPVIVQLDGADKQGRTTRTRVFNDKVWLAADPNSQTVYVSWTRFLDNADGSFAESPVVVSRSTDAGQTFSPYVRLQPHAGAVPQGLQPFGSGSNPQVAPDGTLYVAYETSQCASAACNQAGDRDVTVVATSHNQGRSFTESVVDQNFDIPATLTHENFRLNSFPQLVVDPVTSRLVVTWADDRNGTYTASGSKRTNVDNIVSTSSDGAAWSPSVAVGSAQDEVFGAVASFDDTAAVVSYTRHYDASGTLLDFAYWPIDASSGTVKAGPITRITTHSSDPGVQFPSVDDQGKVIQGTFIGDYAAASLGADYVLHPAWTDFRGNPGVTTPNQDAYTDRIDLG